MAETNTDPMVGSLAPVNADTDTDADRWKFRYFGGNADAGCNESGQHGTSGRSSGSAVDAASTGDAALEDEEIYLALMEHGEDTIIVNPMMIGPMPLQQPASTSLPSAETSTVMAQMALEDDAIAASAQWSGRAKHPNMPCMHPAHNRKYALSSSSSPQTLKSAEKPQSY